MPSKFLLLIFIDRVIRLAALSRWLATHSRHTFTDMKCPGIQHHKDGIDRERAGNQSEDAEPPMLYPRGAGT
jgi:hypothetical protein